jgi:hypothetical protein
MALAQAAPGPNVLFVGLLGWNVGLNAGGYGLALLGLVITLGGMLVPSSLLMYMTANWGHRNRDMRAVRAFKQGMAPIVVGLMIATAWLLSAAHTDPRRDAALWALTALAAWFSGAPASTCSGCSPPARCSAHSASSDSTRTSRNPHAIQTPRPLRPAHLPADVRRQRVRLDGRRAHVVLAAGRLAGCRLQRGRHRRRLLDLGAGPYRRRVRDRDRQVAAGQRQAGARRAGDQGRQADGATARACGRPTSVRRSRLRCGACRPTTSISTSRTTTTRTPRWKTRWAPSPN